jgi:hypothetical protein
MHKSATKCNETVGKWCKNKHGASKIIDTLETYQRSFDAMASTTSSWTGWQSCSAPLAHIYWSTENLDLPSGTAAACAKTTPCRRSSLCWLLMCLDAWSDTPPPFVFYSSSTDAKPSRRYPSTPMMWSIFCHPCGSNINTVKAILQIFNQATGLQVNYTKSAAALLNCNLDNATMVGGS